MRRWDRGLTPWCSPLQSNRYYFSFTLRADYTSSGTGPYVLAYECYLKKTQQYYTYGDAGTTLSAASW